MKKIIYITSGIIIIALFVSNISESDFQSKIDNSTDLSSEYYWMRFHKHRPGIFRSPEEYYYSTFDMKFTNLGLFSIAKVEYGWEGRLNFIGTKLDELQDKKNFETHLFIFGKGYKIHNRREDRNQRKEYSMNLDSLEKALLKNYE